MSDETHKIVAKELRGRSTDELHTLLHAKEDELHTLRFKHAMGQLQKTHTVGGLRRDIARIQTVLGQSQRASTVANGGKK